MKKQIAILATVIAASGFTAYGQDYITFGTAADLYVYDEFTTPGTGLVSNGNIDVAFLWNSSTALSGASADLLPGVPGTSSQYGLKGSGSALDQVATNGVSSVGAANPLSTIASMLSAGWQLGQNLNSGVGSAATGTVISPTAIITGTKGGGIAQYNGGDAFEISASTSGTPASDGGNIEMVMIAWNASAGANYQNASDVGWSDPFTEEFGTSDGDLDVGGLESGGGLNQFGVAPVPEPTTLALAGLGGLSMLFLRRRKA